MTEFMADGRPGLIVLPRVDGVAHVDGGGTPSISAIASNSVASGGGAPSKAAGGPPATGGGTPALVEAGGRRRARADTRRPPGPMPPALAAGRQPALAVARAKEGSALLCAALLCAALRRSRSRRSRSRAAARGCASRLSISTVKLAKHGHSELDLHRRKLRKSPRPYLEYHG